MQIIISAEAIKQIRVWADPLVVPFVLWLGKRTIRKSREALHGVITDNVNRIRAELVAHIDMKILEHSNRDDLQFAAIRKALNLPPLPPQLPAPQS